MTSVRRVERSTVRPPAAGYRDSPPSRPHGAPAELRLFILGSGLAGPLPPEELQVVSVEAAPLPVTKCLRSLRAEYLGEATPGLHDPVDGPLKFEDVLRNGSDITGRSHRTVTRNEAACSQSFDLVRDSQELVRVAVSEVRSVADELEVAEEGDPILWKVEEAIALGVATAERNDLRGSRVSMDPE
jgi:hypothetical protein